MIWPTFSLYETSAGDWILHFQPATKFCLLTSELANRNWEILCQVFADVCALLLIDLQDVPPVCDSGLEHGSMRKRERTVQEDIFVLFFPLSILVPFHLKYGTRSGLFCAMTVFAYIPFISIKNFPEFFLVFPFFSLGKEELTAVLHTAVCSWTQQKCCTAGPVCTFLTSSC